MLWPLLSAFLILVAAYVWLNRPKRPPNSPPGPPISFIFGNIREVWKGLHKTNDSVTQELAARYGDIISVVLPTGTNVIHVMKFEDIKEICRRSEFSGRRSGITALARCFMKQQGLLLSHGPLWVEHRRFALKNLRNYGLGKNTMESIIHNEVNLLMQELDETIGQSVSVNYRFNLPVLNGLWTIVASKRFASGDLLSQQCVDTVRSFVSGAGPQNVLEYFPWLRFVCPQKSGFSNIMEHRDFMSKLLDDTIEQHKSSLDLNNPRDFIDSFLIEMKSAGSTERFYNEENLKVICMDLFVAGMETTSTTLSWAILLMILNPDTQEKVHQEIVSVIGRNELVTGVDKTRLPYTHATMMEVTRRSAVVPRALIHTALTDTSFHGYNISKGTMIVLHLQQVLMNKQHWKDPEIFRPERFIDVDGCLQNDEHLIPFGIGKRACIGESLAKQEFYYFFVSLLQRYKFSTVPDSELSLVPCKGVIAQPKDFAVVMSLR